jgi:K+/H+ antiporter YhaU regulatory subunit KhtT
MGQHVHVQQLPGIGTRYDLAGARVPQRVSLVVHKDGTRELYVFESSADEPTAVLQLTPDQARLLGAVLNGSYVVD